jgi:hypothetical protein
LANPRPVVSIGLGGFAYAGWRSFAWLSNEARFSEGFDEVTGAVAEVRAAINLELNTPPIPTNLPVAPH